MYFKPPQNNMTNPFYHPLNKQHVQEAVTVELEFKKDADGKKAGGKMVRKGVYKMTFKNNAEMNKFMDAHADKLNEDINEGTPAYRKMMKRYKGSDNEKVFKMLRAKGYKVGEQDDTLVQNLLKRHRGNVKKVVDQIVKDYPGKFDVERMMMDHVEIKEGTWAIPDTPKKKMELKKLLQRPIKLGKEGNDASDKLYDLIGDDSLFDALHEAGKENPNDDARPLIRYHMKRLGIKEEVEESVEQVDEVKATARNIVRGLSDSDGPFTVVAMKRDKVIKQESTKMRNMLPAIISEMRKEVGSGVTIAIEDRRGTIRNTFKEGVERVIDNLDDYLAEGSE